MRDYEKLSDEEKREYSKMTTFQLAAGDVEGILELLSWSETTAKYLAKLELIQGTPKVATRLKTYAALANSLIEFITKSIAIGEPDFDKIN